MYKCTPFHFSIMVAMPLIWLAVRSELQPLVFEAETLLTELQFTHVQADGYIWPTGYGRVVTGTAKLVPYCCTFLWFILFRQVNFLSGP